jgi:hypothetical protein
VSQGQNDSGLFETNLRDDRYLPFEGAGVVSEWRIELPKDFRQFDYDTISDVVLHLKYTAREGGELLKQKVTGEIEEAVNQMIQSSGEQGLLHGFSLKKEFPNEWSQFLKASKPNTVDRARGFPFSKERFPFLFQKHTLNINQMLIFALSKEENLPSFDLYLTPAKASFDEEKDKYLMKPYPGVPGMVQSQKSFSSGQEKSPGDWNLKIEADDFSAIANDLDDIVIFFSYLINWENAI